MNDMVDFKSGMPSLAMSEDELMEVLGSSIYPGAKPASIKLVINYCRAINIDPMQKPVHIVPMNVSTGKKDQNGYEIKEKRDVVMPGIGLYRIQASRTGQYIGVSEPTFGPMRILSFVREIWEDGNNGRRVKRTVDAELSYPEWCSVTVKRLVNGQIAEYTAREFWLENYATKSADSDAPNAMWAKRPMGQIAKCAEAQALRKGFPEVGSQPTHEEMEGKSDAPAGALIVDGDATAAIKHVEFYPADKFEANLPAWRDLIVSGKKTAERIIAMVGSKQPLTDAQKQALSEIQSPPVATEYETLLKRFDAATNLDELAEIADLIASVADEAQRLKLTEIYQARRDELAD